MKFKSVFLLILLVLIFSCARKGNPTGGPKDEDAPILINAIPVHRSINFNDNEIRIYFDEYVKLKDIETQLIISPPLKYAPIISPIGLPSKRISLKIKDTLKANTTYVFNFGESIEDNNEGNALSNFKYIFSTGEYIDSLSIKGKIKDAFLNKTDDYISVLLYEINETYNDSTIFKEKPTYITNTLDSIAWKITNIKKGKYKLIALKESQNNYIYEPKGDKIAFLDTIISLPTEKDFELKLFKQTPDFKLAKPIEVSKGHFIFGFEGNGKNLKANLLDKQIKTVSYFEKEKDTIHFFYKGIDLDSTNIVFKNTSFEEEQTLKFRLKKQDSLIVMNNIKGTLFLRDTITLSSNIPLTTVDESKINLKVNDSTAIPFSTKLFANKLNVLFERKPEESYKLEILPNAITDFFDQTTDTLKYSFKTKKANFYGEINLKVENVTYPIIVQLLSEKNNLIDEIYAVEKQNYIFENLVPSNYVIRVIADTNKNKKWDTGNFINKTQPENVYYFNKVIALKENFYLNEVFVLE